MGKKNAVRVKQIGPKAAPAAAMMDPASFMQPSPALEEIRLPVPPDRSYQIAWPYSLMNTDSSSHDYKIIYPSYIDATKTIAQGRRIAQHHAVSPPPTTMDLSLGLQRLGIPHVIQPYKGYSRDISVWDNPGRVMVLKEKLPIIEDASTNTTHKTMSLYRKLAALIQQELPERQARLDREAQERQLYEQDAAGYRLQQEREAVATASAATSKSRTAACSTNNTTSASGTKTNNKKSKKGRK